MAAGVLGYYPYVGGRQMMYLTPVTMLLVCAGFRYISALLDQPPLRLFAAGLVIAGVVGGLIGIGIYYARPGYEHMRPVVQTLEAAYQSGDAIFVVPYAYPAFDYYYLADDPARAAWVTEAQGNDLPTYENQLDQLRAKPGRVWILINCCDDGVRQYLDTHGYNSVTAFAKSTDVSLFLLQS